MLIDTFAEHWLAQLETWATALVPKENLYLLLDTACVPGLHRSLAAALPAGQSQRLLFESLPGCSDAVRDVSPLLVPYTAGLSEHPKLRRALQRCDGWPMVHVIRSAESLQELGQRLEAWCVVDADGQYFNFRFPDTRRLPGIWQHLSAGQRAHLVGPATAWSFIGRDGQWQALNGLPTVATQEPLDTRLTAAQFGAMVADSEADGVLTLLLNRGHTWSRPHSEVYADIAQALHIADAAGALALDDATRIDWCEACMADPALLATYPQAEPGQQKLQRWLKDNRA